MKPSLFLCSVLTLGCLGIIPETHDCREGMSRGGEVDLSYD